MSISNILADTTNRAFPLPERNWKYFQQWRNSFFLHWSVSPEIISELLPDGLEVDTFQGNAWVSLVAFDVHKMRVHYLPPFPYVSSFKEVNVRTYVTHNGISGIYMFSIETDKIFEVLLTRSFIGLPYKKSVIKKSSNRLISVNHVNNYYLVFNYKLMELPADKSELDYWLTERHCLYNYDDNKLYRHDIHHKEWFLEEIDVVVSDINYNFEKLSLNINPEKIHFCKTIDVILWGRKRVL